MNNTCNTLIIFKDNELFGAKNQEDKIIIAPQYMEMQPFSCGLSLVRNSKNEYVLSLITVIYYHADNGIWYSLAANADLHRHLLTAYFHTIC